MKSKQKYKVLSILKEPFTMLTSQRKGTVLTNGLLFKLFRSLNMNMTLWISFFERRQIHKLNDTKRLKNKAKTKLQVQS